MHGDWILANEGFDEIEVVQQQMFDMQIGIFVWALNSFLKKLQLLELNLTVYFVSVESNNYDQERDY